MKINVGYVHELLNEVKLECKWFGDNVELNSPKKRVTRSEFFALHPQL